MPGLVGDVALDGAGRFVPVAHLLLQGNGSVGKGYRVVEIGGVCGFNVHEEVWGEKRDVCVGSFKIGSQVRGKVGDVASLCSREIARSDVGVGDAGGAELVGVFL